MTFSNFTKTVFCRVYQTAAAAPGYLFPEGERAMLKGTGSIRKLPVYIKSKNIDNVLIIMDRAMAGGDCADQLIAKLNELGIRHRSIAPWENTTAQMVEKCAEEYIRGGCKAIIALGGGSVIDCAKLAGIKAANSKKNIEEMNGYKPFLRRMPPIFAVPSTVGSGSEYSSDAVLYDKKQKTRNIVSSPKLRPAAAVLDPLVAEKLPKTVIGYTAMATLCRAVEAYIAAGTDKTTKNNAILAVRLVLANAVKAAEEGGSDAIAELQKAAYLSGVKAGYAHYGALYVSAVCRVSYACAAAVLLPEVLKAYGEKAYKKLAELAESVKITGETEKEKAESFISAIEKLNERLSIPSKLKELKKSSIPKCSKATASRCNPYYAAPKQLFYEDICDILQKIKG